MAAQLPRGVLSDQDTGSPIGMAFARFRRRFPLSDYRFENAAADGRPEAAQALAAGATR